MARLDLSDLGLKVKQIRGLEPGTIEVQIDVSGLRAAVDRFTAAAEELTAAWEAIPAKVRKEYGDVTITLRAHPDSGDGTRHEETECATE